MSRTDADTIEALLAAVDEAIGEYRDSERIGPPLAQKVDWLRRDRFRRSQSEGTLDPQTPVKPLRRKYHKERYEDLYDRAVRLSRAGMTDLPPEEENDIHIYRGLRALKHWCMKNLHGERPAEGEAQPGTNEEEHAAKSIDSQKAKGKRPGRRAVSETEDQKRQRILLEWKRAAECGISRDDFCEDKGITIEELEKMQGWKRQRDRRS